MSAVKGALHGVRVIDCTHVIAGSWCSLILADLGADVIKVEGLQGDVAREAAGSSGFSYFEAMNRNKRGIAIDLTTEAGQDVVRRMAAKADIFVENYRTGALDRMNLGYAALAADNPGLVYCSISGFGDVGPYRQRGGLDLIAQALSGLMSMNGEADGAAIPVPVPLSDLVSGIYAAVGVLAALQERSRSGLGQHVMSTLLESALSLTVLQIAQFLATGASPVRHGPKSGFATPYEAYPTADGHIIIAASTESLWRRLAAALDRPQLLQDPRFATMAGRLAFRAELDAIIAGALATASTEAWLDRLTANGIPTCRVNDTEQALADPQIAAMGSLAEIDGERYVKTPVTLSRSTVAIERPAPTLGQHSRELLAECGLSEEAANDLFATGIVAGASPTVAA